MLDIQITTTNIRYADGGVSSVNVQIPKQGSRGKYQS